MARVLGCLSGIVWVAPDFYRAGLYDVQFIAGLVYTDDVGAGRVEALSALGCQAGALGQVQVVPNVGVGQEPCHLANEREFIVTYRSVKCVAEQWKAKVGGYLAAGGVRCLEVGPVSGVGDDTQVSLRPFVGHHASISQGDCIVFCPPQHQRGYLDLAQAPAQVILAHGEKTFGSRPALTRPADIGLQAYMLLCGDPGALGEGGRTHQAVGDAHHQAFDGGHDQAAQPETFQKGDGRDNQVDVSRQVATDGGVYQNHTLDQDRMAQSQGQADHAPHRVTYEHNRAIGHFLDEIGQ